MSHPAPDGRRRLLLVLSGVLPLLGLVVVAAFGTGVAGVQCRSCHPERTTGGVHTQIGCADCHARGAEARLAAGIHATSGTITLRSVLGQTSETSAVRNTSCGACHDDIYGRTVALDGLRMAHSTCIPEDAACGSCHGDALHERAGGKPAVAEMDTCLSCHGKIQRKEGCDLCHSGKRQRAAERTGWSVTHGANWQTTHGAGDLDTCAFCHFEPESCTRCHIAMPHPEDWTGAHGGVAAEESRKACTNCHQNAFCDSCHGIEMPHPATWLEQHPRKTAGYEDSACLRCHLPDDCSACHVMHTHPGLDLKSGVRDE